MGNAKKIIVPSRLWSRGNKYKNVVTYRDGVKFASEAEARRYDYLKIRQRIGEIQDIELQPKYQIKINGSLICTYVADFRYREVKTGAVVVEDVKGFATPQYRIKKKLMAAVHGIEIIEIEI